MHYLTKQKRAAKVGDLMRNTGDGARVMQVTEIRNNGDLIVRSYGRVVAGVWKYATQPRRITLHYSEGHKYPYYYSPGSMVNWVYDIVKINE